MLGQQLFSRFAQLPIPTLCCMNGITAAGGLLFSLLHDFRFMINNEMNFTCLAELNVGLSLTPAFASIVKYQLQPWVTRTLMFGGKYST